MQKGIRSNSGTVPAAVDSTLPKSPTGEGRGKRIEQNLATDTQLTVDS